MRKIDKTVIRSALVAQEWADTSTAVQAYPSHAARTLRYVHIKISLLVCQGGLCAYTEQLILDKESLESCFDGHTIPDSKKEYIKRIGCHLDHFDPNLKKKSGWKWDNFFAVAPAINVHKGKKEVDSILKPDSPDYDPFHFLAYNDQTHEFSPKSALSPSEYERVQTMIAVLGLNEPTVVSNRTMFLKITQPPIDHKFGRSPQKVTEPYQFPTAYQMYINNFNQKRAVKSLVKDKS